MKNYKRAFRRHMKQVKFEKRLNNWFSHWQNSSWKLNCLDEARRGQSFTFLRTTGKPCSCAGCSPTYSRKQKHLIQQQIWDDYLDS